MLHFIAEQCTSLTPETVCDLLRQRGYAAVTRFGHVHATDGMRECIFADSMNWLRWERRSFSPGSQMLSRGLPNWTKRRTSLREMRFCSPRCRLLSRSRWCQKRETCEKKRAIEP